MFPLRHKRRTPPPSATPYDHEGDADDIPPDGLPPPALASSSRGPHSNIKKTATFDQHGVAQVVRVHWSKFKKRISPGTLTESLVEITESHTGSESLFRKRGENGSEPPGAADTPGQEDEEVDETVVDNTFWVDSGHTGTKSVTQPSEKGISQEKSGNSATHGTHGTDADSLKERTGFWQAWDKVEGWSIRLGHLVHRFFFTSFYDPVSEAQYRKETYYQGKALSFWGAWFIVLNWVG